MPQLQGREYPYTRKGMEEYERDKHGKYSIKTRRKKAKTGLEQPKKRKKKYSLSEAKQKLKRMGRRGDTELEHVNKQEQRMLRRMGASRSKNPRTGLTENFSVPSFRPPKIKITLPKSSGDVVKDIQKSYDTNVKGNLPKGLDPYNTSSNSGSGSGTTTMSGSGGESGFGGMKRRKKRKKPGEAEGDSQGQNTKGGKMSKRGLRTPKRTGLNIVKKNSSSTSLGM